MNWNLARALQSPRSTSTRPTRSARKQKIRPSLEFLEGRQLLTTFTWSSTPADGNWDNAANWVGGQVPKSGPADLVFPITVNDQTLTLQADDANLQITSLNIAGGNYTFQGPSAAAAQPLTVANGATLTLDGTQGATLKIAAPNAQGSLALNFLGSASIMGPPTKSGGNVTINSSTVTYSGNPAGLLPLNVDTSNLELASSAHLLHTLVNLTNFSSLVVIDGAAPAVGSVNGTGSIQIGTTGQQSAATGLSVNTPAGETDLVNGNVQGNGGTLLMNGAGSFTVTQINPVNTGPFMLQTLHGNFGLEGTSNLVQTTLGAGSTFTGYLRGTAAGQATKITATGTTNPVDLGNSTLALVLDGYVPAVGDRPITLVSSAHGITGQFGNAGENGIVTVPGDTTTAFRVNYTATTVTLTVVAQTSRIPTVSTIANSNPITPGASVTYSATVVDSNNNPVHEGYFSFWYTDDFQAWHQVANQWILLNANGQASVSRGAIPRTVTVEAVVGFYHDVAPNNYRDSWTQDHGDILFQLIQFYHTQTAVGWNAGTNMLTATISSPDGTPTWFGNAFSGNVLIKENGAVIGSAAVTNGVATFTVSGRVARGTYFTVQYIPDAQWSIIGSTGSATA
jgi:hypothetical protein